MTKEELEEELKKATGEEIIDKRDYCGVDGYYGVYLDKVNAEMLRRFNRLEELEKENAKLKEISKLLLWDVRSGDYDAKDVERAERFLKELAE